MRHIFTILLVSAFFAMTTVPAIAQFSRDDIRISCFDLKDLQRVLHQVVNRQQVYNNDEMIWHSNGSCAVVPNREFTANSKEARRNGVFNAHKVGFFGWIVTERWLVPVEHFAYLDRAKEKSYRPADIYPRDRFTLLPKCFTKITVKVDGVRIYGHQLDYRGRVYCDEPIIKTN
jgi:hypothetical protein